MGATSPSQQNQTVVIPDECPDAAAIRAQIRDDKLLFLKRFVVARAGTPRHKSPADKKTAGKPIALRPLLNQLSVEP